MSLNHPTLLVVDDEPLNLVIIEAQLDGCGYSLVTAENGSSAWDRLKSEPDRFDVVLLDRMMPDIDGIEILRRIKQDPQLKLLPVILQTAANSPHDIATGLREGAFYYLTKPFSQEVLREVVATALRDRMNTQAVHVDLDNLRSAAQFLEEATFVFRDRQQAQLIASMLACACPNPQAAAMGLLELMLNAIEHGNLEIGYEEKTTLLREDRLDAEIDLRLQQSQYAKREACVKLRRFKDHVTFTIIDEGHGFVWQDYLELSPERMMDNHGRGIAMARKIAFTHLAYLNKGNIVEATVALRKSA
jgi:CheY-like chemotaxis protein